MFDAKRTAQEIIVWIRDYFMHNAPPGAKAVIGISGGKDSAVAAALCAAALGKARVLGVLMPQGEQWDIDVSRRLCAVLEIPHITVQVETPVQALLDGVALAGLTINTVASFNTPARIRMAVLYAISGIVGGRVVNTSNLSEDWVGYATKFGDAAGDFGPLSDLTVAEVKAVGRALGLAAEFVDKVPVDGLCGQSDEENLGFTYAVLDRYIREGLCEDPQIRGKIDRLHAANLHKISPMPVFRLKKPAGNLPEPVK